MSGELILVGGGGHARVVGEAARAAGWTLVGYVDRASQPAIEATLGIRWLGDDDVLDAVGSSALVLGLGATRVPRQREALARRLEAPGRRWATVIHPSAVLSPSAVLDAGAVVLPRAVVHAGARIGAHAVLNTGSIVEHDAELGPHAMVGPGAIIGGGVRIGPTTFVGLGAAVRDHVRLGAGVLVAMGAAVVDDVPDGRLVKGVPARDAGRSEPT